MLITEKRLRKVIRKTILEQIKAQLEEGPFMDLSREHGFEKRQGGGIVEKWSFGEAVLELLKEDHSDFFLSHVDGRPTMISKVMGDLDWDIKWASIKFDEPVSKWEFNEFEKYHIDPNKVQNLFSQLKGVTPGYTLDTQDATRRPRALEYDPWSED